MNTYHPHTADPEAAARLGIARSLASFIDGQRSPPVSLRNTLAHLAGLEPLGKAEAALRDRMELLRGERLLGQAVVPWVLLARGMGAAIGPTGGFAVGVDVLPMQDALRGDSALLSAGASVFEGLKSSVLVPRLIAKPALYWTAEHTEGASSDAALGAVSATPRAMMGRVPVSVALLRIPSAEAALRAVLRRGVAEELDAVAVAGTGGAKPLGILNTPGVGSASGTSLSYASIWAQIEALITAGAKTGELFAVAGATAGRILATRERAAGAGYILDGGRIGGVPCTVTANVPAATLVLGVASQLAVSVWGAGPEIRSSGSAGFNTASVDIRVALDVDVSVLNPGAFVVFGTVT